MTELIICWFFFQTNCWRLRSECQLKNGYVWVVLLGGSIVRKYFWLNFASGMPSNVVGFKSRLSYIEPTLFHFQSISNTKAFQKCKIYNVLYCIDLYILQNFILNYINSVFFISNFIFVMKLWLSGIWIHLVTCVCVQIDEFWKYLNLYNEIKNGLIAYTYILFVLIFIVLWWW